MFRGTCDIFVVKYNRDCLSWLNSFISPGVFQLSPTLGLVQPLLLMPNTKREFTQEVLTCRSATSRLLT